MVTPSGWHDDAYRRDAGHDAMQMAVWKYLRNYDHEKPLMESERRSVVVEYPIVRRGAGIVAFVDVADLLWYRSSAWTIVSAKLFEIKPSIKTVFGIVRQCNAIEKAFGGETMKDFRIYAVVPFDDPKIEELSEAMPGAVLGWDNVRLTVPRMSNPE
jgi:hypothetical protein